MQRRKPNRDPAGAKPTAFRPGTWIGLALGAVLASAGACVRAGPELLPASGYTSSIGRRSLAGESRSGLAVTADASVWHSQPKTLAREVTPVWVTLRNTTGRPLRVQYDEFRLRGASGAIYIALAPYASRGSKSGPAFEVTDGGAFDKFYVAPYMAASYPWLPVWTGPLPYGPSNYSVAWRAGLPTASMLERALPEGVMEDGGTVSGYLYFQKVRAQEGKVTFLAGLQEPSAAREPPTRQLASIEIPFVRVYRRPSTESLYEAPPSPVWMY